MAPPLEVEWDRLSPTAREVVAVIGLRLAAGYLPAEVAQILDRERPPLKHLELPRQVSTFWVNSKIRQLRAELTDAATS